MKTILLALLCLVATNASAIDICTGGNRAARKVTCLVDGDTGWEKGEKWRLLKIDTPEIEHRGCEAELQRANEALARLQSLMSIGYKIDWEGKRDRNGRKLVYLILNDGRDAGDVLLSEKLAQPWPNKGNIWCGTK